MNSKEHEKGQQTLMAAVTTTTSDSQCRVRVEHVWKGSTP